MLNRSSLGVVATHLRWLAFLTCLQVVTTHSWGAISLNQLEQFSNLNGWTSGGPNPNPPSILADSGPLGVGDNALKITSNGGSGAGGKLIAFNQSTWNGDYVGSGILEIAASLRNGGATPLSIRLAFNGSGGWFVTAAAPISAFSGWSNVAFDVRPNSLINAGGTNASSTMLGVTELRILHSFTPTQIGAQVSSTLLVDNLRAVPEPSSAVFFAITPVFLLRRKR